MNAFKEYISQYLTWEEVYLKNFISDSATPPSKHEINEIKCQLKIHIASRDKILKGKQICSSTHISYWVEIKNLFPNAGQGLFVLRRFLKTEGNYKKNIISSFIFNICEKENMDYDYIIKIYRCNYKYKFNCTLSVSEPFEMSAHFCKNSKIFNKFVKRGKHQNNAHFEGLTMYESSSI